MTIRIAIATPDHLDAWAAMRATLWPDETVARHRDDAAALLARDGMVAFLALTSGGEAAGFVEASIRRDHVNGCDGSPVAFVEGLYVAPPFRRAGVAASLVSAVADRGRAAGCRELASDAPIDNRASHAFHRAAGFEETERVVYFRRML